MQHITTRIVRDNRMLHTYAMELAYQYCKWDSDGYYDFTCDDLEEHELSELTRLYIEEVEDRDIGEAFFDLGNDPKNDDLICLSLKLLQDNCPANSANLANLIVKRLTTSYKDELDKYLDDVCSEYYQDYNYYNDSMQEASWFTI